MATNSISLYKPHDKQREVHTICNDFDTFFISVNAGRQSGKTALSQQQALFWALNNDNVLIYWVSPTQAQATKVYKQLLDMVGNMPFLKSHKGGMGDTELIFTNKSRILFRSAAQEDSLRGETIEYLIVDEAAFCKEDTFNTILLPMLNVRGRKCLIISTPKGKNWFHGMIQKGNSEAKDYASFLFTSYENPYASKKIIDIAKGNMPDVMFRQEYLGEFVDNSAIFENLNELCILDKLEQPIAGDRYFVGIDIALKDDYTVITIINQDGHVVSYERFNNTSAPQVKENIKSVIAKWKPVKTMIEENNQGNAIIDDLIIDHKQKNIVGFKTTAASKPVMINNLIAAFSSKKVYVPKDSVYRSELEMFIMVMSKTGQIKFEAASGFHDDIPMSLAIAWECRNKYTYSAQYNFL